MSKYNTKTGYNKQVYALIEKNKTVLDVGCGSGALGKQLMNNKNATVYGIDSDKEDVNFCTEIQGYKNCYNIDLNCENNLKKISFNEKFDYIIFADVLEHLANPNNILIILNDYLKQGGKIIISVPNIAFILYRLKLLFGIFNYEKYGVMDETHLKFFTLNNYKQLLPLMTDYAVRIQGYSDVTKKFIFLKHLAKIFPSVFALQFIIIAQKNGNLK